MSHITQKPRKITLAIPFTAANNVTTDLSWVSIGSISRVDIIRLTSNTAEITVWIGLKGIPKSTVNKLPSTLPSILQGKYPISPNTSTIFTIASFQGKDATIRNDVTLTFFNQAGSPLTHTGVVYFNVWTAEEIEV